MKKMMMLVPVATLMLMGTGCKQQPKYSQTLNLSNIDTTVDPKADFYEYACGGWMKNNPLTGEYSRFGSFDQLRENNKDQLLELIDELATNVATEEGVAKKIGTIYNISMDSAKRNEQGYEPIKAQLESIKNTKTKEELVSMLAGLHHQGIMPFFICYVAPDADDSKSQLFGFYQSGISLPDRDYYISSEESTLKIKEAYANHVKKMFELTGFSSAEAMAKTERVVAMETRFAKAQYSREELREPKDNFNRTSVADLQKMVSAINWKEYLSHLSPNYEITEVNVGQVPFMKQLNEILKTSSLEDLKAYYEWNVINSAASYLSDDLYAQNFEFYGKALSGQQEMRPRWKRAVSVVEEALGEGLGQMYVEKYFPAQAKERMLELVDNIKTTMNERFEANTWMSDVTKAQAKEKLSTVLVKVGYPDKWRNYDALEVKDDALYANILRSNRFEIDYMMSKLGKPVDRSEWQMSPQTVNAYYDPTTNEICFPAGILQEPFFYAQGDDAINYGAIGVVIAHELTHGFDDQGRQFNKDGNLKDWWTAEDAVKFAEKTTLIEEHFNKIIVIDTLHANGKFTLGENIADNGGLNVSYAALQKALSKTPVNDIDGFTPSQRFFLSYANVWACNIRDAEIRRLTMIDPHSLGRWRVNGTLPHVEAFLQAFDIKEGDPMWLSPDKRAVIW